MRLAEFGNDVDELQSVVKQGCELRKIFTGGQRKCIHTPFSDTNMVGIVSELYVNGQFQDVWCDSHVAITNASMYYTSKWLTCGSDSCYVLYSTQKNARLMGHQNYCLDDTLFAFESYFFCA
jgi:hypothetical protein